MENSEYSKIGEADNLLYVAIADKGKIICQYTDQKGDFQRVSVQVAQKVNEKSRQSFKHHLIKFHTYHDGQYLFLCMTEENYNKRIAYKFLEQIRFCLYEVPEEQRTKKEFLSKVFANKILKQQFEFFNTTSCDKTLQVRENLEDLKQTLLSNLDKCVERGEQLDVLLEKSQIQVNLTTELKKNSKKLKNIMWWKNAKFWIALAVLLIFGIYIMLVIGCDGFALQGCLASKSERPIVIKSNDNDNSSKSQKMSEIQNAYEGKTKEYEKEEVYYQNLRKQNK